VDNLSTTSTHPYYHLRPYNPARETDRISLNEICENVYGGSDYLPKMAEVYATDPCCSFLALTIRADNEEAEATPSENDEEEAAVDDTGAVVADEGRQATSFDVEYDNNNDSIQDRIIAVANYKRLPSQKSAWIEAVRTHPSYRNRGLATIMLRSIVDVALSEENTVMQEEDSRDTMAMQGDIPPPSPPVAVPPNTRLLTCTIQSNQSMIRALTKSGFNQCNTIPILQFSTLTNLPGWKQNCQLVAQPLLHALELTHLVSPIAKALSSSSSWTVLSNEQQLIECLQLCKEEGGCSGYLPGLYEYIIPGPNRLDLQTSLQSGLVLAFDGEEASTTATTSTNTTAMEIGRAILVLTQDERISSLKSKWVCSIVAYTRHAFEAALWMAHSDTIARLMMHHSSHGCQNEKENDDEKKEDEDFVVATQQFCLVFDDAVPLEEGTLAHALPRVTDECIVFSYGGHP
jgi:hypothetical protein